MYKNLQNFLSQSYIQWVFSVLLGINSFLLLVHEVPSWYAWHFIVQVKLLYVSFLVLFILLKINVLQVKRFYLLTAPGCLILLAGNHITSHIHYTLGVFVALWGFSLGFWGIYRRDKKALRKLFQKKSLSKKKNTVFTRQAMRMYGGVLGIIAVFLGFGTYQLGQSVYTDEKLWTYGQEHRIEKYWMNVGQRDWKNTRPSDKPGVTLALISGPGLLFTTPSDYEFDLSDSEGIHAMFFALRLPLVLFGTLSLGVLFFLLKRLFTGRVAFLSLLFVGLSPILLGSVRIINPDALTWIFVALTFFAYFLYLKEDEKKWLYLTGVLLGLALLTKYISNILVLFFFGVIFLEAVFRQLSQKQLCVFLRAKFLDYLTLMFIAIFTVYILYPGTWVENDRLLLATLWSEAFLPLWKLYVGALLLVGIDILFWKSRGVGHVVQFLQKFRQILLYVVPGVFAFGSIFVFINVFTGMAFFDFEHIIASPKSVADGMTFPEIGLFSAGLYVLLFAVAPLALVGAYSSIFDLVRHIKSHTLRSQEYFVWYTVFFILTFYAGSIVSGVALTQRYQIVLYPLFLILSGIGWGMLFQWASTKLSLKKKRLVFALMSVLFIISHMWMLMTIKPYFFSYNSALLPREYVANIKDMGDGVYESTELLNHLPNAEYLSIWSDRELTCLYFVGKCTSTYDLEDYLRGGPEYDYFVVSRSREQRIIRDFQPASPSSQKPLRLDLLYTQENFMYEITPGTAGRGNYIRIFHKDDLEIENLLNTDSPKYKEAMEKVK